MHVYIRIRFKTCFILGGVQTDRHLVVLLNKAIHIFNKGGVNNTYKTLELTGPLETMQKNKFKNVVLF